MQTLHDGKEERKEDAERRFAVSIQGWEDTGAPHVGYDAEADAWALSEPGRDKSMTDDEILDDMHGFYVLELMRGKCDGISNRTHAGMYNLDETSFRGSFLEFCVDLIGEEILARAWTDCMRPEEAVDYVMQLLAVADRAGRSHFARDRRGTST